MDIGNSELETLVFDLMHTHKYNTLDEIIHATNKIYEICSRPMQHSETSFFYNAIIAAQKRFAGHPNVKMFVSKDAKVVKFIYKDFYGRKHALFVKKNVKDTASVQTSSIPDSDYTSQEFKSIEEIVLLFMGHVDRLSNYFEELERIDNFCCVVEPREASYKENYRKIYLDDRVWLHIEISPEGVATNLHIVGNGHGWHDRLQAGLLTWDQDLDIVENIRKIFDFAAFPQAIDTPPSDKDTSTNANVEMVCGICLSCDEKLSKFTPLPLCLNAQCRTYYHSACLYQWLVACSGGRVPSFGVASGDCPSCFGPITCAKQ